MQRTVTNTTHCCVCIVKDEFFLWSISIRGGGFVFCRSPLKTRAKALQQAIHAAYKVEINLLRKESHLEKIRDHFIKYDLRLWPTSTPDYWKIERSDREEIEDAIYYHPLLGWVGEPSDWAKILVEKALLS